MRLDRVDKARYSVYLRRARNFASLLETAYSGRNWDGTGLAAVHCVISACDALVVYRLGLRSRAQDHGGLIPLLIRAQMPESVVGQVREVLAIKNRVEYEARDFGAGEAAEAAKGAKRVLAGVERLLPK